MITKVKKQQNGYIANGDMYVPNDEANNDYQEVIEWIANGGVVEDEYTREELATKEIRQIKQEALMYLACTDFYFTVDKYSTLSEAKKEELTIKRAGARRVINGETE